jgi:hypothetical protein
LPKRARCSALNAVGKLLPLTNALEKRDCIAVSSARISSIAGASEASSGLGAEHDGILARRKTVVYGIIAAERPRAKALNYR